MQLARTFDYAHMTGHVWPMFVDGAGIDTVLRTAHAHLRPGGTLAFDTRNPDAAAWEHWTRRESERMIDGPGVGPVAVWHAVVAVDGTVVKLETSHAFNRTDCVVVSRSRLRFMCRHEIRARLETAGFDEVVVHGDWDGGPETTTSAELIVIARRPSH
jgi:hypothetical protein